MAESERIGSGGPQRWFDYVGAAALAGTIGFWQAVSVLAAIGIVGSWIAIVGAGVALAAVVNVAWIFVAAFIVLLLIAVIGGYRVWSRAERDLRNAAQRAEVAEARPNASHTAFHQSGPGATFTNLGTMSNVTGAAGGEAVVIGRAMIGGTNWSVARLRNEVLELVQVLEEFSAEVASDQMRPTNNEEIRAAQAGILEERHGARITRVFTALAGAGVSEVLLTVVLHDCNSVRELPDAIAQLKSVAQKLDSEGPIDGQPTSETTEDG